MEDVCQEKTEIRQDATGEGLCSSVVAQAWDGSMGSPGKKKNYITNYIAFYVSCIGCLPQLFRLSSNC
jgi:hypothetical protein